MIVTETVGQDLKFLIDFFFPGEIPSCSRPVAENDKTHPSGAYSF